jgi:hypothetical protein
MVDFSLIRDRCTRRNIENGYTAVNQLELWEWFKTFEPDPNKGFMLSSDHNVIAIGKKMHSLPDSPGHSGLSFAFTMWHLKYIANNGMDKYKNFHETGEE